MSSGTRRIWSCFEALMVALGAILVCALALWMPSWWGLLFLGVGVTAFLAWLYFHPDRWYRRMTGAVLGAWITLGGMPAIMLAGQWDEDTFLRLLVSGAGGSLHIAFAVAFLGSLAITAWVELSRERDAGGAPVDPDPTGRQVRDVTQQAPEAVQPVQVVAGPQSQVQVTVEAPAAFRIFEVYTPIAIPLSLGCAGIGVAVVIILLSGFDVLGPAEWTWLFGISLLVTLGGMILIGVRVWAVKRVFRNGVSVLGTIRRITPDGRRVIFNRIRLNPNGVRRCSFEYEWNRTRYRTWNMFENRILDGPLSVGDAVTVVLDPMRPRAAYVKLLYITDPRNSN